MNRKIHSIQTGLGAGEGGIDPARSFSSARVIGAKAPSGLKSALRRTLAVFTSCVCLQAQQPFVENHQWPVVRVFNVAPPKVSPAILGNSTRLRSLMRAGRLYLTLQDAIAAAIENDLDLQVDRYGPLHADWYVLRSQGGGPLRGSTQNQGSTTIVVQGQGVSGAESAAGLLSNNRGGSSSQNGGSFTQIGTVTPNLDPTFFANTFTFSHYTQPQGIQNISGVQALVDYARNISPTIQQGLLSGGIVQAQLSYNYQRENSPGDVLNPSYLPVGYIYATQNLLSGRGIALNARYIHVAQKQALAA